MHTPVRVQEILEFLNVQNHDMVIDATFGCGGHTEAILNSCRECFVFGIDRDEAVIQYANSVIAKYPGRFSFVNTRFSRICEVVPLGKKYDAILFDFGMSSLQVDNPSRGFSFSKDGILDMRMSKTDSQSAFDVVNSYNFCDLADVIYHYGDETRSRKIASNIVHHRQRSKITTTTQLKNIIDEALDDSRLAKIDNATKTFQALRILVNDELREISKTLEVLQNILNPGARIITISFHSLEDRIVKLWQKSNANQIHRINKKVVRPSQSEVKRNVRSRSAVLRAFVFHPSQSVLQSCR
jgi:16S rRNA (cytosine1402-N4)-methyltransferase